jgi:hypothetical protein
VSMSLFLLTDIVKCQLVPGVYPFTRKGELFICFPKTYKLRYFLECLFHLGRPKAKGLEWLKKHE